MTRKSEQQHGTKTRFERTSGKRSSTVKRSRTKSSRDKVKAHRDRMRRRGMKLIQIWVPDPRSPYFAAEAPRQSRMLANSPTERDDQSFIDAVTDWDWN
jgi:Protein  of unknown function (DUF3018)